MFFVYNPDYHLFFKIQLSIDTKFGLQLRCHISYSAAIVYYKCIISKKNAIYEKFISSKNMFQFEKGRTYEPTEFDE